MFYQYEEMIRERREQLLQEAARERLAKLARQHAARSSLAASTLVWAGTRLTRWGERMQGTGSEQRQRAKESVNAAV